MKILLVDPPGNSAFPPLGLLKLGRFHKERGDSVSFLKGLSGFDTQGNKIPYSLGHFFIAINVESFIHLERFRRIAGDILRSLRESKKAPGRDRIFTAGEKEYICWMERKDRGVPLNRELQRQFLQMRNELKLDWMFRFD